MPNTRNFPGGTTGWTGSTMRENVQEDCFLPCDSRLVAVNVGPDGTYGSLVFDTNQNNEYDSGRSAFLQSALRVIKKPIGAGYNALGFQLYLSGNKDTKGGFFVDQGDGSTTSETTPTGTTASGGSGMVASGPGAQKGGPAAPQTALPGFSTNNPGASGGIIIGQGSFNDGGPFHVGNKKDKHFAGKDADGNPINALHIATTGNFYKNQIEDGPLRFEDIYQVGQDQSIVVPVHLGWSGQDWAWWTTSYFYQPPGTAEVHPGIPGDQPGTATPGPSPTPTPGPPGHGNYNPDLATGGYPPAYLKPGEVDQIGQPGPWYPSAGTSGAISDGGAGGQAAPLTPGEVAQIGQPGPWNDPIDDPSAGFQNGLVPIMGTGSGTGSGGTGPSKPVDPGTPPPPPDFDIPYNPKAGFIAMVGSSVDTPAINLLNSTLPLNAVAGGFQAVNYSSNQLASGMFSGVISGGDASAAVNKQNSSAPQVGGYSSFGDQGSSPNAPAPSPAGNAANSGGTGDPWVYTSSPKGKNMPGKPMSKFRNGTATGGIVYHPPETDLRDISVGLVPSNVTLSTMYVLVGPNSYFGCGVPALTNGGIKSGYRWGLDSSTGDLVWSSVTTAQAPVEAMRLTNTGQNIQWNAATGFAGILTHANTTARTYTFPDKSGTVAMLSDTSAINKFQQTADGSASGAVTNVSFIGTGVGSQTIAANKLVVGSVIRVNAKGYYSTVLAPGKLRIGVVVGASVVVNTGLQNLASSMTNEYWEINDLMITIRTTGGGGTLQPHGAWEHMETAGVVGSLTAWEMFLTGTTAVDTTASNLIDLVATFDTAGNTITCTQCLIEQIG